MSRCSLSLTGVALFFGVFLSSCDKSTDSGSSSGSTSTGSITYGTLTDSRDEQTYKTVTIGTQTWMAQSLNYKVDSTWCPDGDPTYCSAGYGRLYKWAAAMGLSDSCNSKTCLTMVTSKWQGICPSGWHVPTDSEWGVLIAYVGIDSAGTKLKSTSGWRDTLAALKGTNQYGFNVLPAGHRYDDGTSYDVGYSAHFWSSSEIAASLAWGRRFDYGGASVSRYTSRESDGFSLRCVEN